MKGYQMIKKNNQKYLSGQVHKIHVFDLKKEFVANK